MTKEKRHIAYVYTKVFGCWNKARKYQSDTQKKEGIDRLSILRSQHTYMHSKTTIHMVGATKHI